MGVSAVPGSGKTHTLSYLAAELVADGQLGDDQEVLIVTLVNSAVDNFAYRVGRFVEDHGLLPHYGYRVRTLHGLAHDIVRERPDLVGLAEDFQIIDERAADHVRQEAAIAWLRAHPQGLDGYLRENLEDYQRHSVNRQQLPELLNDLALTFIRSAKDSLLSPELIKAQLDRLAIPAPLAEIGCAIYTDYQRALVYSGMVDFDDLISLALQALQQDALYLSRLQLRWPYILEDEAQDSSRLQEEIIKILVGNNGNWVRVGDPNQAIFETFTTASPRFLRNFLNQSDVLPRELPDSGRSSQSIIDLANQLIRWVQSEHPRDEVREALSPPFINPVPPGDPQPNPADRPELIQLIAKRFTPQEEIVAVAGSLARWLPDHPESTVAVLVPRNKRGFDLVDMLKQCNIPFTDTLLRSSTATRETAGVLSAVVNYLADPKSPTKLAEVYRAWRKPDNGEVVSEELNKQTGDLIRKSLRVEDYLWPRSGKDWLHDLASAGEDPAILSELEAFRGQMNSWQSAILLPVDQLILTLAQDLFAKPADLAVAHKLAVVLRQSGEANRSWRLPEFNQELSVVARNERRFVGFSEDDSGFDPQSYRGKVVVATIHKAKGLEWDRVYLMSVNNYDFPSGAVSDRFISEPWYLRDQLNLPAEALDQLQVMFSSDPYAWYEEGKASANSRLDYVAERLRLFYVGITRAKQELVITWNSGRNNTQQASLPLVAMQAFWEGRVNVSDEVPP